MSMLRYTSLLFGLTLLTGCDQIEEMTGISLGGASDPGAIVEPARDQLDAGDLPAALSEYEKIAADNPNVVEAQVGLAYVQLLAGNYDGADATLEKAMGIEELPPEKAAELQLRRAIVALRKGDLEGVRKHGEASGLPAGKVLAAEVYLADAEADAALPLLKDAASAGGTVGQTANTYLEYLNDVDTGRNFLAEATALWALGQHEEACETAEELLKFLPLDFEGRDELLLMWAGRAVTSGRPVIAEALLDEGINVPDQVWRVEATRALVLVGKGEYDEAKAKFENLKTAGAPADGLADALATAAAISDDAAFAAEISGDVKSNAIARGLLDAGDAGAAKGAAPSGTFSRFLESQ